MSCHINTQSPAIADFEYFGTMYAPCRVAERDGKKGGKRGQASCNGCAMIRFTTAVCDKCVMLVVYFRCCFCSRRDRTRAASITPTPMCYVLPSSPQANHRKSCKWQHRHSNTNSKNETHLLQHSNGLAFRKRQRPKAAREHTRRTDTLRTLIREVSQ